MLLFHLGLLDHYPKDHTDFEDCLAARDRLGETLLEGLTIINQAVRENYRIVYYTGCYKSTGTAEYLTNGAF